MEIREEIRLEPLGGGLEIYVTKAYGFTTDAVLLADFAAPNAVESACDLGTGCGVIPLLWQKAGGPRRTVGVELQPEACGLAERSVARNGLEDKIRIANADLRYLPCQWKGGFDLVVCNPPYFKSLPKSPDFRRAAARTEGLCTLTDVTRAARRLLRPGGRFCLCQRPDRLADLIDCLRACELRLRRLQFVSHSPDKPPFLLLAEAGAGPGFTLLPHLFLQTDGRPTAAYRRIYRDFFPDQDDEPGGPYGTHKQR